MKTDLIFSFDAEDFTSNVAADAIYREAEILRNTGIRGCFCVVGLLAQQLRAWRRNDVIDALSHHEIATHSWGHSYHPTINEYTDIADFNTAYDEVIRQETLAKQTLEEVFRVDNIHAAVPPGNQKSYAAMYAYADMGIPIYADTVCDTPEGDGVYYCNIYHIEYAFGMESCFTDPECDDAMLLRILDKLAGRRHAIVYTHPHMAMFSKHWDSLNYYKSNQYPFGQWVEAPRRTEEETERFYRNFERFAALASTDERFHITTYSEVADRLHKEPVRMIVRSDLYRIREHLENDLYPFSDDASYSLADMFHACRSFLCGAAQYLCGKNRGFLAEPVCAMSDFRVTKDQLCEAANAMDETGFLPTSIMVGNEIIGPADFLYAALEILCGADSAHITARRVQLPVLDAIPQTRDLSFVGTWMHSDDFEDRYLSDRLRLQSWTMRFHPKKIT